MPKWAEGVKRVGEHGHTFAAQSAILFHSSSTPVNMAGAKIAPFSDPLWLHHRSFLAIEAKRTTTRKTLEPTCAKKLASFCFRGMTGQSYPESKR